MKFARCNLANESIGSNEINKEVCELINKQSSNGVDTVHWGKYCIKQDDASKVSMKYICEQSNTYIWQDEYDTDENRWKGTCFNMATPASPTPLTETELCSSHGSPNNSIEECIITVPSTTLDSEIEDICKHWSIDNYKSYSF